MIIAGGDITLAMRRTGVRQLADVTEATFDDADIDRRLNIYDDVARTFFGVARDAVIDPDADYFTPLVAVANYLSAINIRQGIAGEDNVRVVTDMIRLYKDIVAAFHGNSADQHSAVVSTTSGIGNERGAFA